jgi:hypothetical protein
MLIYLLILLENIGNVLYHLLQHSISMNFAPVCIYVFRMILTVNSDYFLKQR